MALGGLAAHEPTVDLNTVLGKVVAVLFAFRADDQGVPLAELARRTGIAKGTLHRVVADLVDARLLDRRDDGYRLSNRVFQLGMRASMERDLLEIATPFMEDLYERTHETVHLGVLDEDSVVYVAKIGGHRQADAPSRVGGRMPLHCTAIGKALLAWSPAELFAHVVADGLPRRTPGPSPPPVCCDGSWNASWKRGSRSSTRSPRSASPASRRRSSIRSTSRSARSASPAPFPASGPKRPPPPSGLRRRVSGRFSPDVPLSRTPH
ncbi:IclR family transcriptional regulator [Blastococcus sp. PRF04-17]|nr:IclR family transcriptional regulator [Blastococcus sp. PRF04-17]UOY03179.1 IclR family transcriptional regulator [Blastococcus sp. PRF04-17]